MFRAVVLAALSTTVFNAQYDDYTVWRNYAESNLVIEEENLEVEDSVDEKEVDEDEVNLLAHLIFCESNTLGETGMYYTGSVVLNRVNSDDFPDTLYGVIYQKGQYACVKNGAINKTPNDISYEIAEDLLLNGSVLPENVVFQAEFTQGSGVYTTLGNTYYCYK